MGRRLLLISRMAGVGRGRLLMVNEGWMVGGEEQQE
jgi:hypothetical protein